MDWTVLLRAELLPQALAVLGMLVLAVALLGLGLARPTDRVFALVIFLRAASMGLATLREASIFLAPDPEVASFAARLFPYFIIATPPALLYFLVIYPRRRGPFARGPLAAGLVVLGTLTLEALYLFDHSLWYTAVEDSGVVLYRQDGPLSAMLGVMYLSFAFAALVFARDYHRQPAGPTRQSTLLVALAFLLNAVYDGAATLGYLAMAGILPAAAQTAVLNQALAAVGLVPAAFAGYLLLAGRAPGVEDVRRTGVWVTITFLACVSGIFSAYVADSLPAVADSQHPLRLANYVVLGLWRLAVPALVTYALLQYQLFGIDLKIKLTIRRGTVAFMFLAVFFVAGEVAQNFLSDKYGTLIGGATAGLLLFALAPLQRMAERVSDAALPKVSQSAEYMAYRRLQIYKAAVEGAMADGRFTAKERAMLDRLRKEMGLRNEDADALEREVSQAQSGGGTMAVAPSTL